VLNLCVNTTAGLRYSSELYSSFVTEGFARLSSSEVLILCTSISLVRQRLVTEVLSEYYKILAFMYGDRLMHVQCRLPGTSGEVNQLSTGYSELPDRQQHRTNNLLFILFFLVLDIYCRCVYESS